MVLVSGVKYSLAFSSNLKLDCLTFFEPKERAIGNTTSSIHCVYLCMRNSQERTVFFVKLISDSSFYKLYGDI